MIQFALLGLLVLLGHVGWWVFCYNRINATPLPRKLIKSIELSIVAIIVGLPLVIAVCYWQELWQLASGVAVDQSLPGLTMWCTWSLLSLVLLAPMWLESRFWLIPPRHIIDSQSHDVDVAKELGQPVTGKWISHALARVPFNEITHLSVTQKCLQLDRDFEVPWHSVKIGHLSDLHFTGQLTKPFYRYVIGRMMELAPDIIMVTGDIIDKDYCLDWLDELLGPLSAPLGCYFLFGNHEKRLSDVRVAAERLNAIGWIDVGASDATVDSASIWQSERRLPRMIVCGNERPWFERHTGEYWSTGPLAEADAEQALRIGMAHTPDQHVWARRLGLDLLLAGHTHGGQVRVPLIGPIIAPSRYGSRFASGVFHLAPTLMHVSRGLAGTQPLRWRCLPEISLLEVLPGNSTIERADQLLATKATSE